eukprot:UN07926
MLCSFLVCFFNVNGIILLFKPHFTTVDALKCKNGYQPSSLCSLKKIASLDLSN